MAPIVGPFVSAAPRDARGTLAEKLPRKDWRSSLVSCAKPILESSASCVNPQTKINSMHLLDRAPPEMSEREISYR